MFDLLEQLQIVDAERVREMWAFVGVLAIAIMGLIALAAVSAKFKLADHITKALRWCRTHPVQTCVLAPMVLTLLVYGGTKPSVITPSKEDCDFHEYNRVERSGFIEYYRSTVATNGIQVALANKVVTNSFDFAAGDFLYCYDTKLGKLDDRPPEVNPWENLFCVRDSITNAWTVCTLISTQDVYYGGDTDWKAMVARLPNGEDPKNYRFWFIGAEEYRPEIVHEGGVGIVIDREIYTSKSVTIQFHPDDEDLKGSPHTYVLQMRRVKDGILLDWETVMSIENVGWTGGTFIVQGYTVGEYRMYRIYADKEVE